MTNVLSSMHDPLSLAFCALLGLVVGSFLNVVIARLPRILDARYDGKTCEINLLTPASHCPACRHKLAFHHNIPVISWLLLRGRCAFCDAPISVRYPIVELLTASSTVLVYLAYGATFDAVIGLIVVWTLICLTFIDIRTYTLPDEITLGLLWAGLLVGVIGGYVSPRDAVIGAVSGYASLWLLYKLFKLATKKEGLGYGDMKLLAALGAVFGWQALPFIVLAGTTLGLMISLALILAGKMERHDHIPFAPYLSAGAFTYLIARSPLSSFELLR